MALWRATAGGRSSESRDWKILAAQSSEQLRDSDWLDVIHPDDRPSLPPRWRHALADWHAEKFEFRVRGRDER